MLYIAAYTFALDLVLQKLQRKKTHCVLSHNVAQTYLLFVDLLRREKWSWEPNQVFYGMFRKPGRWLYITTHWLYTRILDVSFRRCLYKMTLLVSITKTCPWNKYPIKPDFYTCIIYGKKLGYARVYLYLLF